MRSSFRAFAAVVVAGFASAALPAQAQSRSLRLRVLMAGPTLPRRRAAVVVIAAAPAPAAVRLQPRAKRGRVRHDLGASTASSRCGYQPVPAQAVDEHAVLPARRRRPEEVRPPRRRR